MTLWSFSFGFLVLLLINSRCQVIFKMHKDNIDKLHPTVRLKPLRLSFHLFGSTNINRDWQFAIVDQFTKLKTNSAGQIR